MSSSVPSFDLFTLSARYANKMMCPCGTPLLKDEPGKIYTIAPLTSRFTSWPCRQCHREQKLIVVDAKIPGESRVLTIPMPVLTLV